MLYQKPTMEVIQCSQNNIILTSLNGGDDYHDGNTSDGNSSSAGGEW